MCTRTYSDTSVVELRIIQQQLNCIRCVVFAYYCTTVAPIYYGVSLPSFLSIAPVPPNNFHSTAIATPLPAAAFDSSYLLFMYVLRIDRALAPQCPTGVVVCSNTISGSLHIVRYKYSLEQYPTTLKIITY